MKRAEKRRNKKLADKAANTPKPVEAPTVPTEQQLTIQQAIDLGVQHHSAGDLPKAEGIYQQVLKAEPKQPVALHLLGVIAHQVGKNDIAMDLIGKALAIKPDYAEAHNNLGNTLREQGKLDDAVASYHKALGINPDYAEAHYNLGNALQEQGKIDDAVASYHKALAIKPDYADAHNNLGNALKDLGKLDDAVTSYNKALAIKPNYADAHYNLGNALAEQGKLDDAVTSYNKALAIKSDYAKAWNNLNFAVKALQFSNSGKDGNSGVDAVGLDAASHTNIHYALQQFYLNGFRPHEADESLKNLIAALPPVSEQTLPINGGDTTDMYNLRLPNKVVALLSYGRSGTGLLHSLIDGHPEISTLPSVYLRGYFNSGVWDKLSTDGWRGLPERFADEFAVLFDARTSRPIPGRLGETSTFIGRSEGMMSVGDNRDEFLSVDRDLFCRSAIRKLEDMESVDPMSFLMVVHAAYDDATGLAPVSDTTKQHCFYHIHNPDDYAKNNFLRYAPKARLLMMVREPIQNCVSSISQDFHKNHYDKCVLRLLDMLLGFDQVLFRVRKSVGLRLEDLKARPEASLQALCSWMGVEESPTLYEMTAQGKKWWGDPSSPSYTKDKAMSPFDDAPIKCAAYTIFGETDQFVLKTLFYPFRVRFGYCEPEPAQFGKDLKKIRPLLNDLLDFEKTIAERSNTSHEQFKRSGSYQLFRAGLMDRCDVLDEFGTYPHMLTLLNIP